jgi:endonuclease YncB( thermonuclease family)
MTKRKKYGFSFSWKRASGLSAAKGKLSRQLGIPLTKSGRRQKAGKGLGCCIPMVLLLTVSLLITAYAQTTTILGRVVGVSDGDTITVLDSNNVQHRIRIQGIDSPEKDQPFGSRAKEHLSSLVFDQLVEVAVIGKDKYGRTVGKVLRASLDIGLAQIEAGYAWHYKDYQKEQTLEDRKLYATVEDRARNSNSGLWSDRSSIAPWKHRKSKKIEETDEITASPTASPTESPQPSNTSQSPSGGTVNVQGYYRKDGTYVKPHTRKAPKRKN